MSEYVISVDENDERWHYVERQYTHFFGYPITEEIVRCRDCEHARHYHPLDWRTGKPHETVEEWYCEWHSNAEGASEIEPNGYCAWGERRVDA